MALLSLSKTPSQPATRDTCAARNVLGNCVTNLRLMSSICYRDGGRGSERKKKKKTPQPGSGIVAPCGNSFLPFVVFSTQQAGRVMSMVSGQKTQRRIGRRSPSRARGQRTAAVSADDRGVPRHFPLNESGLGLARGKERGNHQVTTTSSCMRLEPFWPRSASCAVAR